MDDQSCYLMFTNTRNWYMQDSIQGPAHTTGQSKDDKNISSKHYTRPKQSGWRFVDISNAFFIDFKLKLFDSDSNFTDFCP